MRRIFVLGLFLLLVFGGIAYAVPPTMITNSAGDEVLHVGGFSSYTVVGSIATSGFTYISTTILPPGSKILGYQTYYKTGFDMTTSLWDASSVSNFLNYGIFINEAEQFITVYTPIWFPYPKKLTYGLMVCNYGCDVVIYYAS